MLRPINYFVFVLHFLKHCIMVCLGISVCSLTGQVLVSRHFIPMSRARVEGLLSSFPKLLESNAQHTYLDTDQVRLVFQPLDKVYLIMMTNKKSNILQDLNTLNLFAKIVQDTCSCTDQGVTEKGFELIHAFDEVISGGQPENLDLGQIKTILEMDSHEEKIHEMIEKNKELEAKAELKRKAKEMDQLKRATSKTSVPTMAANTNYNAPVSTINVPSVSAQPVYNQPTGRGMKLGASNPNDDFLSSLQQQVQTQLQQQEAAKPVIKAKSPAKSKVEEKDVHVTLEEHLTAQILHDGGISNCELKGEIIIKINNESYNQCIIEYLPGNSNVQFKSHPLVDKKSFASNLISSRSKPFPTKQPLSLVKYRCTIADDDALPLHIECWPNPNGDGTSDVNLEYELPAGSQTRLTDVIISINIPYLLLT
eukprot:NODE_27_length_33950_cov_0.349739.p8 type:complete len:423 gc:universal NODE_27_length_33950_cov_0.349739:16991-18259(+)